jgi:hypothetical protein
MEEKNMVDKVQRNERRITKLSRTLVSLHFTRPIISLLGFIWAGNVFCRRELPNISGSETYAAQLSLEPTRDACAVLYSDRGRAAQLFS